MAIDLRRHLENDVFLGLNGSFSVTSWRINEVLKQADPVHKTVARVFKDGLKR